MNPLETILGRFPLIILDGAFATELEARGCNLQDPLWSAKMLLEDPAMIRDVHRAYLKAGADCIITASYQATVEGFEARGLGLAEAQALLKLSVTLAKEVRDEFWHDLDEQEKSRRPRPLVAASVGPYGAFLANGSEYRGDYDIGEEELVAFHRERMALLVDAGPDILACETIPCLVEARALVRCLETFPAMCCWFSFSCRDGGHLRNGDTLAASVRLLDGCRQVAAIGVNCTEPRYITSLIEVIAGMTQKPVLVYPNSGEFFDQSKRCWSGAENLPSFAEMAESWYRAGARLIGGCCRTTPADIRAISERLRLDRQ